jgi:hypothetical protein
LLSTHDQVSDYTVDWEGSLQFMVNYGALFVCKQGNIQFLKSLSSLDLAAGPAASQQLV